MRLPRAHALADPGSRSGSTRLLRLSDHSLDKRGHGLVGLPVPGVLTEEILGGQMVALEETRTVERALLHNLLQAADAVGERDVEEEEEHVAIDPTQFGVIKQEAMKDRGACATVPREVFRFELRIR